MSSPESIIGATIDQYQLVEYLGEGAIAKVYKAYHPGRKQYASMKILHPQLLKDEDFVNRFVDEARNLRVLKHPNVVQLLDASITPRFPYLVMEYVQGKTLRQFINEYTLSQTRIPLNLTLRIIYSVGLALSFAHQNRLVHRDVKPSNILLEDTGRVVLTDFGMAKLIGQPYVTPPGLEGTPAYISPEQALGQAPEPASDLYSLGIIFFELLTSLQPHTSKDDPVATTINHLTHDIPSPIEYFPELPEEVAAIVLKATRRNIKERYATMVEFLEELTRVRLKNKTAKLPTASLKELQESSDRAASWSPPDVRLGGEPSQVSLHFIETGQVLNLKLNKEYLIGRQHKSQPILPDIDLTPFNAYEWGISRMHASLAVRPDMVSITDIGSANGTWHNGKRIPANQPYPLNHGDVLHLGKLKVQILNYLDNPKISNS
jgi:serine/threonine protein kinase